MVVCDWCGDPILSEDEHLKQYFPYKGDYHTDCFIAEQEWYELKEDGTPKTSVLQKERRLWESRIKFTKRSE